MIITENSLFEESSEPKKAAYILLLGSKYVSPARKTTHFLFFPTQF